MTAFTLNPATPAHAPLLAALHEKSFPEPWTEEAFAGLLGQPGSFGFIASLQGEPAGFILCRGMADEAEILTIAVDPPWRARGCGGELLSEALKAAAPLGVRTLFLEVAEDNRAATALYRRHGFTETGRRAGYYGVRGGAKTDALVLSLAINS